MRNLIETVKRFFYWGWTLRNSYDWDYGYVETIIHLKLKRLKYAMDTDPYHMNLDDLRTLLKELDPNDINYEFEKTHTISTIKCHKSLRIVISILERRKKGIYSEISGVHRLISNYTYDGNALERDDSNKTIISKEEYRSRLRNASDMLHRMEERDQELLYKLMGKYSGGWWT